MYMCTETHQAGTGGLRDYGIAAGLRPPGPAHVRRRMAENARARVRVGECCQHHPGLVSKPRVAWVVKLKTPRDLRASPGWVVRTPWDLRASPGWMTKTTDTGKYTGSRGL